MKGCINLNNYFFKKTVSSVAAIATLLTNSISVCADTTLVEYNSLYDEDPSSYQYVTVDVVKAETYSVTLPKTIVLDGSGDSAEFDFTVIAEGDISATHYVRVIPLGDVKLTNEDESVTMDLSVTQEKKRWDNEEVVENSGYNETSGGVSIDELEPGEWTGKIKYYVSLDDGGMWTAATCTEPATCIGYDTNDNGVIDDDELLDEPITKGTAKGHTFDDDTATFPGTCNRCAKTVYVISTPAQLVAFSTNVNNGNAYLGATVELGADIDMSGVDFTPIGTSSIYFSGNFNGNGYTISNLKITGSISKKCFGLFGYLKSDLAQTIKNFTLKNEVIVLTDDSCTANTSPEIGAVVGQAGYIGKNFDITVSKINVINFSVLIKEPTNCTYPHDIDIGGVIGYRGIVGSTSAKQSLQVNNCSVTGTVTLNGNNYTSYVGGIISTRASQNSTSKNNFVALSIVTANSAGTKLAALSYAGTSIRNNVVDYTVMPYCWIYCYSTIGSSGDNDMCSTNIRLTTDEAKSQTAVDVLNTDNTTATWVLDLENENNGYPLVKMR